MYQEHNHVKVIDKFLNKELRELYITVAIRTFALSLIGIFIPIYLYKSFFTIGEIALFYLIIFLFFGIFIIPAAKFISKKGYKHSIYISLPSMILPYLILSYFIQIKPLIYFAAVFLGFSIAFFWIPFHLDVARFSKKKKRGKQISTYVILTTIAGALGPIIGGLILTFFNFSILFILVSILLFLSLLPLTFSKEIKTTHKFSFLRFLKVGSFRKMIGAAGHGSSGTLYEIFWPLFIFLIIKDYIGVGGVSSIIYIVSLAGAVIAGFLVDKFNRYFLLKVSSIFYSIVIFAMTLVKSILGVIGINISLGIIRPTHNTNFDALSYDYSRKNRIEEIVFKEMSFSVGRVFLLFLVILFPNLLFVFILASFAALLSSLYARKEKYVRFRG